MRQEVDCSLIAIYHLAGLVAEKADSLFVVDVYEIAGRHDFTRRTNKTYLLHFHPYNLSLHILLWIGYIPEQILFRPSFGVLISVSRKEYSSMLDICNGI